MAVTVLYLWPATAAVAPTALQVADTVVASVQATADADILAAITHNMGLSAAELALGFPEFHFEYILPEAWVSTPHVLAAAILTNSLNITMSAAGGSGVGTVQFRVVIKRPHTDLAYW